MEIPQRTLDIAKLKAITATLSELLYGGETKRSLTGNALVIKEGLGELSKPAYREVLALSKTGNSREKRLAHEALNLARQSRKERQLPKELRDRRLQYWRLAGEETDKFPHAILSKEEFDEIREGTRAQLSAEFQGEIREIEITHAILEEGKFLILDKEGNLYETPWMDFPIPVDPADFEENELRALKERVKTQSTPRMLEVTQSQHFCVPGSEEEIKNFQTAARENRNH